MRTKLKATATLILLLIAVLPALAAFHLMKVVEVFPGTAAAPNAQYVVIQMYTSGQQFVGGHTVTVFNAAGAAIDSFTFESDVSNGNSQAKLLIATPQAQAFFGLGADLIMSPSVLKAGGKVCFDTIDCVAWGAYTGSATGVGTPFNAGGGLQSGRAALRRLDIAGSASTLDAADDTNNSANDFVFGLPAPRNNAGVLGTVPGATCGNGALEGLEQCDDNNLVNGDGCSSTCIPDIVTSPVCGNGVLEAPEQCDDHNLVSGDGCSSTCTFDQVVTSAHYSGDYDNDGKSDVFWRNSGNGANAIWRSGNNTTQQVVVSVGSQSWKVVGVGDFDGDGKSDVFWRNSGNGANAIWRSGNNATQQATIGVTSQSWKVVGVGDFDGDGKSDVFWRNSGNGANAIWKSGNYTTQQPVVGVSTLSWRVVGVGDFDGDGKSDVFWRNSGNGANAIWKSGNNATQQPVVGVSTLSWRVVGVGDFDGDGKSDVFWRNGANGANAIWRSGNNATQQPVVGVSTLSWKVVGVGDFDGDGKSDVFWRNSANGANAIWRSGNNATQLVVATVTSQAWIVVP